MHFINPFRGLRPSSNFNSIVVPSTDHLSREIIDNHKKNNPWSYLNVLNPDNNQSLSDKDIKTKAKQQLELMKAKKIITKDIKDSYYIYKISSDNHSQIGIIGTAKLSAYDNLHIRGHEEIYLERAQERSDQMLNLNAQIGPIYVIYPDNQEINNLINDNIALQSNFSFQALDECNHSLWVLDDPKIVNEINNIFNKINRIYIADGHHRIEAMLKLSDYKKHQNSSHTGEELYNYAMVAAFPQSQARILDYNRLVKDLYGYSKEDFLKQVKKRFNIEKKEGLFSPNKPKTFGMYINNSWHSLELKKEPEQNLFHINNLDINLLHYYLLEPILGIGDPRYDKRLDFISGFHGIEAIQKKVDEGEVSIGFSLFPTQIEDVITFADKKLTMPPKSTWFDPKPLDGLVAFDFEK